MERSDMVSVLNLALDQLEWAHGSGHRLELEKLRDNFPSLIGALRFYEDERNWICMSVQERGPLVDEDGGKIAEQALTPFV